MIAIVSSEARERATFASFCEQRGWNSVECPSVRAVKRIIGRAHLRVVLVRHQLQDGYSDDVIATLGKQKVGNTKVIVLVRAGTSSSIEARQLTIGADCIQRDPVRSDVLLAYIDKYVQTPVISPAAPLSKEITFSGATFNALDRSLQHAGRTVIITPREVTLIELLHGSAEEVLTYEMLYDEILGRRFQGDTSNMRVLLAKLSSSANKIGLSLRHSIEVIPKAGYRYRPSAPTPGPEIARSS